MISAFEIQRERKNKLLAIHYKHETSLTKLDMLSNLPQLRDHCATSQFKESPFSSRKSL